MLTAIVFISLLMLIISSCIWHMEHTNFHGIMMKMFLSHAFDQFLGRSIVRSRTPKNTQSAATKTQHPNNELTTTHEYEAFAYFAFKCHKFNGNFLIMYMCVVRWVCLYRILWSLCLGPFFPESKWKKPHISTCTAWPDLGLEENWSIET